MSVTIAICAAGWLLGWWAFGRVRFLSDAADRRSGLGVTIVIPARNEALSLPNLLGDLAEHRPPGSRVIVVDDHSSDGTAELAAAFDFVDVIEAPALPDGWTGKSWACHTGATAATGDAIVFLDADVRINAGSLDQLVSEVADRGGLVSVQPWHRTERPYEQCSALFNTIAVMGAGAGARGGPSGAFGPVLATTLADYRSAGGHESVRTEVVEDLALARRYRTTGQPVHVMLGGRSIRFRMYPAGIRQLAEGWTKNFASGASSIGPARLLAIFLWITSLGSSSIALADAARGNVPLGLAAGIYALFVLQLVVLFRLVGRFGPLTALCYPALFVFFCGIFVRSLWRTYVRRSVQWRDRQISVGPARS
jgi:4,4'-diaponeurosporenoate glycosyltransferase